MQPLYNKFIYFNGLHSFLGLLCTMQRVTFSRQCTTFQELCIIILLGKWLLPCNTNPAFYEKRTIMNINIARIRENGQLSKLELAWIDEYIASNEDFYSTCDKVILNKVNNIQYAFELVNNRGLELINLLKHDIPVEVLDKESSEQLLSKVANQCAKIDDDSMEFDPSNVIKAVSELNKMQGNHAPTNVRVLGEIDVQIGYDFSAMEKPKTIEGIVLDPANLNYISPQIEFNGVEL